METKIHERQSSFRDVRGPSRAAAGVLARQEEYSYSALHVYVAGVPEPWVFEPDDEFKFNEESGLLIVRDGPTDEDNNDNAEVPEYVFRLDAIVATQLV